MRQISHTPAHASTGIERTLLKPYRAASVLAAVALLVSLAFLAYTAWSWLRRLDPLERHLASVQHLQNTSLNIQELLIRQIERKAPPDRREIDGISAELNAILQNHDGLRPTTADKLREARQLLAAYNNNPEVSLRAALTNLRNTLAEEDRLQRSAVDAARRSARAELLIATIALVLAPAAAMAMLASFRRRAFQSLGLLSEMLENAGNLEFHAVEPQDPKDPLSGIFKQFNAMTEKLRQARDAASQHRDKLASQIRVASETLLRQQRELADGAQLAAIGEFSARVAHELRNPVSGISLALRNLEEEIDDTDQKDRIHLVLDELERINRLVSSLLDQTPQSPEVPTPVFVPTLIKDVVRLFEYQLPENVTVRLDTEELNCRLARDTVRQVLLNLLRNSAEAIGERGGRILIEARRTEQILQLIVSDDGPGYPDDLLHFGIRPFLSGNAKGTGLGLAIVRRLVKSVGGELHLANSDDGGACTTVTLPCKEPFSSREAPEQQRPFASHETTK